MIILKVIKNHGLSLEGTFFEKAQWGGGGWNWLKPLPRPAPPPPPPLYHHFRVKVSFKRLCLEKLLMSYYAVSIVMAPSLSQQNILEKQICHFLHVVACFCSMPWSIRLKCLNIRRRNFVSPLPFSDCINLKNLVNKIKWYIRNSGSSF